MTLKPKKINTHDTYALIRFIISIIVLAILGHEDLQSEESIPNIIYILIGGLNGVDAYKLYNDVKKDYDK